VSESKKTSTNALPVAVPLRPAELDVFDWASNICSHETSALYVQVQSAGAVTVNQKNTPVSKV
jgi:hypothetical protein